MFVRSVLVLSVTCMSLCCAEAQRKLTQSTMAPAPVGPSITQDLLDVLSRNQSIGRSALGLRSALDKTSCDSKFIAGPQLYKTAEAAVYTSLVHANDSSTVSLGQ